MKVQIGEIKTGFWLGLGVALALALFSFLQIFLAKAVHRGG